MIKEIEFQGKKAIAAFITRDLQPADEADAEMVKIIDSKGTIHWLTFDEPEEAEDEYDPSEKRDEGGKWTSGGAATAAETAGDLVTSAPARQAHADGIVKKYGMTPVKVSEMDGVGDILAFAGRDGITINSDHWTPERIAKYEKEWTGLAVDATPEGVLTHELGHAAFAQINQHHFRRAEDLAQKFYDESNGTDIFPPSPYAQENSHEWAAEAFNAVHLGRVADIGPKEKQAESLAHCQKFWEEMRKLKDEPPDPPKRRRGKA
jgi:hypothetical protein